MKPLKLNMSKFHKIGGDEKHTVMRHQDGHEIRVSHKALSPEAAKQLQALPIAKKSDSKKSGDIKPQKMAKGGEIPGGPGSPAMDSDAAQKSDEYYANHPHEGVREMWENMKKAFSPSPEPTPKAQKMADGGQAKAQSSPPEINKKDADAFTKGFNNPDPIVRKVKEVFGMADGGNVADNLDLDQNSSPAPAPEDNSAPPQQMPGQPSQPVINVNVGGQQPPMSASPGAGAPSGITSPSAPNLAPAASPQQPAPAQQATPQGLATMANEPIQAPQGADPFGVQAQSNALMQGIDLQRKGIVAQGQIQNDIAAGNQLVLRNQIKKENDALKLYNDNYKELEKHRDEAIKAINDGKVDPNRFWSQKSVPSKIATAIGLIFGGAGAAMSGQENLAYNLLKHQINNDIDAQKANLGKQQTLLGAYQQKMGNLRDATDMTRLMLNSVAANQIQLEAAKQGGPMAAAIAAQNVGKLNAENAAIIGQSAARKSILQGAQQGMVDPAKVVNVIVPPDQRAAANKELDEAQTLVAAKENALSAFDQINKLATLSSSLNPQSYAKIHALKGPITAQLSKATAGRFTEQDAQYLDAVWPERGNSEETVATKRQQLVNLLMEKMHPNNFPILKTYNILPSSLSNFGHQVKESAPVGTGIQESAPVVDPADSLRSTK